MTQLATATGTPMSPAAASGERTICEFWPSIGESNSTNALASSLPLGLGIFVYFPLYVIKALKLGGVVRYTLTNRRLRVDRGMAKKTTQAVALEAIADVRLVNYLPFTRTGDLEIVDQSGKVVLLMTGIQDPAPVKQTILDAATARTSVDLIMKAQAQTT